MSTSCHIVVYDSQIGAQGEHDQSFIGGRPRIPPEDPIPLCKLCRSELAFFFQVKFPNGHDWAGKSLAVFACVACANEDKLIPAMLSGPLSRADIPVGFLEEYQDNFRFLVFPSDAAVMRACDEKVEFKRLALEPCADLRSPGFKIGGVAAWIQDDEAPSSYAGEIAMSFLLQLPQGYAFKTVSAAPAQVELGLDGRPIPANRKHYELFLANAIYMFATADPRNPLVYAITQVP